MAHGNMWLKARGIRKGNFLRRFCSTCLNLCVLNLLVLIFLFWSANKNEVEFVLFLPCHPLKQYLCSVGEGKFLHSFDYFEVQLSAWMCKCLSHITMQSEFRLTSQFWSFFTFGFRQLLNIFGEHHQCGLLHRGQLLLQTYLEGGIHWA